MHIKTSPCKYFFFFTIIALTLITTCPGNAAQPDMSLLVAKYDVRILRDSWGVPHIFGKKDTDVAFGLAYAHAQDDFKTSQLVLTAVNGRLASVAGRKWAGNDYLVQLMRLWDTINARYETDLSYETRALCEAYADGVNYYAALHPDETFPGLFPINGKHIVAGFVHKMPLMVGVDNVLLGLFKDQRTAALSPSESMLASSFKSDNFSLLSCKAGSNALAVSPIRASDGKTLLAINSHQPWEGPVTWYEVQVHSEEGWNMTGGLFPGSPVVFHGHNEYLGWAHTNNYPDLVDTYVLEMNPDNPNQYRFDGQWRDLEIKKAPIRVKLLGPLHWTVNMEVGWSVYGPVVRRPHGVYAIRWAGMGDIRQVEQWYRMNKAHTMEQWEQAVRMSTLPMFNCTYADKEGNILYHYQALLPLRAKGFDWKKAVPGNTSQTLWTGYLPYDKLPRVKNPASGFVINCNNTPYHTTLDPENPRKEDYAPEFGIEDRMTNRSMRALALLGADPSITEEAFYTYKYDMAYAPESKMARMVSRILALPEPGDKTLKDARKALSAWDLQTNPDNRGAALAVLSYMNILETVEKPEVKDVSNEQMLAGFEKAAMTLSKNFGSVDVRWDQVNRLIRGHVDLGLGGGPDVLHDVDGDLQEDGRIKGNLGDSYVLLVTWDKGGMVHSRSIHQYGSATLDQSSPHYADQSPLFVKCELKPVWREESEIRRHLESEYRPGEELKYKKQD
jgi:acyl-homoserine-lactone acylase